ncbi:UNVERIFIED_CONTAM: hypothetical protein Sradi_2485300 [Sesamum radiatum]|uniref:F-box domain-containing protein n=1 Tax=Sesamum radiatum TaxID=300843 RepID=A0AAW2SKJ6_SESRA
MALFELLQELVQKIAGFLETETEVTRFRAICSAWRSFTEEFSCTWKNPCFPSFGEGSWQRDLCCTLTERIVYCIESPERTEPSFWLVKTERTNYGKLRLLNP